VTAGAKGNSVFPDLPVENTLLLLPLSKEGCRRRKKLGSWSRDRGRRSAEKMAAKGCSTTRPGPRRPHQFGDRLARELCFGGPVYSESKRATTRTPRICKDQRRLQNCPFAGYKNLPSMLRNQLTGEAQSSPPTSRATGAFGQPPLRKVEDPYRLLFLLVKGDTPCHSVLSLSYDAYP
jgi:hypothetical protein